jgi:hypothetical protein
VRKIGGLTAPTTNRSETKIRDWEHVRGGTTQPTLGESLADRHDRLDEKRSEHAGTETK